MTLTEGAVRGVAASIRDHEHDGAGTDVPELRTLAARLGTLTDAERSGLDDSIDEVQIASKLWLIEQLTRLFDLADRELLVIGAWYGILPLLINWRVDRPPRRMLCIDIDSSVLLAGQRLIGPLYDNIEYRVADAMTFDYAAFSRHADGIVVNTICEHLPRFDEWWASVPKGQIVALQSNDYFLCPDHVNAVNTLEEMKAAAPMTEVLFEGALPLLQWHRFMLIGSK
jgi:SAM-dependent methyltransferase